MWCDGSLEVGCDAGWFLSAFRVFACESEDGWMGATDLRTILPHDFFVLFS
jgi:hypothetical protein